MRTVPVLLLLAATACSNRPNLQAAPDDGDAPATSDGVGDGPDGGENAGDNLGDPPGTPVTFIEARGVLHIHSPYSHDACDGNGLPGGVPNAPCLADLRTAPCEHRLDFVALTDHPSNMRDHTFEQDLLYDASAGDQLISINGAPIANRITCANGHSYILTVGYESTHTMPLGLNSHLPSPALYAGLTDATPIGEAQTLIQSLKDAGAVTAIAHSEGTDISAARILEVGLDAMEWYNPHGNFKTVLGGDIVTGDPLAAIELLKSFDPFLLGASSGAHADLIYLLLLPSWPVAGFDKWREVQKTRGVTGVMGSDVHQNVSVDPLCSGGWQTACAVAAQLYPHVLTLLISGGTINLTDGERLDSYARILRWLENRVLVTEISTESIDAALAAGRNYGLFSVFGDPVGFTFHGNGGLLPIGSTTAGTTLLTIQTPQRPVAMGGAPFNAIDGDRAQIRVDLLRTDTTGTTLVRRGTTLGELITESVNAPGAYHVEIWIKPLHLEPALGNMSSLASTEYMWLITNPIRLSQ